MMLEQMTVPGNASGRTCGRPCEIFSRVCGYHRPVKNWNKGKKEEFKDRKVYLVHADVKIRVA